MGCCLSTKKPPPSPSRSAFDFSGGKKVNASVNESRTAPISMEEETVKEVLSETATPKPAQSIPISQNEPEKKINELVPDKIEVEDDKLKKEIEKPSKNLADEEISEVSEICSLSESISTATFTDKLDDNEEINHRVHRSPAKLPENRSFSGDFGPKREKLVTKSPPAKRYDPSPARRNGFNSGSVRLIHNRDTGQGMVRTGFRSDPFRRDPGEKSGRRSRSPAVNRTDSASTRSPMGRSQSVRRSGRSPGRVATAPPSTTQKEKAEEPHSVEDKWPTNNESLDNPLVSLECFIFL